jgi:UrcA family protein
MNACFLVQRFGRHAALAAAIYCAAFTTTSTAEERNGKPLTKVVSYSDLNMNSESGVRALYGRLKMGATQVCAPFNGGTLRQIFNWRDCVDEAVERSVHEIDQPQLTAYHLSHTGKTEAPLRVAKDR